MVVRAKSGTAAIQHQPGPPKTISIGQGQGSKPRRRGRKKLRGQGK